jgi:tetratricopeptide (TPR) repeat protein/peptidoglycan/xylan/chitin deacetylase (PgdA/CDA1 family)
MTDDTSDKTRYSSAPTQAEEPHRHRTTSQFPLGLFYVLIAICLCLAWFSPVQRAFEKRMWPPAKSGPRDAYAFISLAYVDSKDDESAVSTSGLNAHLDALSANGYSPITLQDVRGLVHQGDPVPRKAVLLTIDSHRKSTTSQARRVLREHGWNAVMFVDTQSVQEGEKGAVGWQHLKALSESDNLEISLMGHRGEASIAATSEGKTGHYLTSLRWLQEAGRQETPAELQARVVQDHLTSCGLAKENLGEQPLAYAYPFGDFGQYCHPDDYAGHINLAAATEYYDLSFIRGNIGVNTMFSDPTRLNRMAIAHDWTSKDLLAAIGDDTRKIETVEDMDLTHRSPGWIADWGDLSHGKDGIRISASPETHGGRTWLAGSDLRKDLSATVNLTIEEGDAAVYLRAASDDSAYVLLQLTPNGETSIKQKESWEAPITTLATTVAPIRKGKPHRLDVFLRGQHFDALLDGNPIFEQSIRLKGTVAAGRIGIGAAAAEKGVASVQIQSANVQSRKSTLASWTLGADYEPYIMDWLHRHAGRLTELSPPWPQVQEAAAQVMAPDSVSIYRRLTRMYDLRLTPRVDIASDADLQNWSPSALAERVGEIDCEGIYINFERHSGIRVDLLENWLQQASRMLSGYGRPLLVRLPPMLERLASVNALIAVIPAVEIVTGAQTELPITTRAQPIREEVIEAPQENAFRALPVAFAIADKPGEGEAATVDARIKRLRDDAEAAFHRSAYEKAIATFSEWHQLEPTTPRPLTRIGDALISLGYHDEAVGFFRQSLSIAPGQVDLAVRQARLLTNLNRKEAAKELLNAYARLFPNNTDILFAQAEWLYKQDRSAEAEKRIERILALDGENFDASLFLLRLASDETGRTRAVDRLMALSTTPERHFDLANAVWQYDLLTLPDSHLLVTMLEDIAAVNKEPRVQNIVNMLRPRTDPITETFKEGKGLSDAWQIEGASASSQEGLLTVVANPARLEFTVRLMRSERWRDSFIEADMTAVEGGFWLYARRSRNHLVRFGFDAGANRLYLQAWKGKNNDIVLNQFVPWSKPEGSVTMRLEVRGNGISALINGEPAFDIPLAVPGDFGLGWAAFAVNGQDRGKGHVVLSQLRSGPLPVRLALLPASPSVDDADGELKHLRKQLGSITDFSPDWFAIDAKGGWSSQAGVDDDFFRLFSRYYRVRLVPTVRVAHGAEVLPEDILTVTRTHNFDGLVLLFETMPPESWFERMDRELGSPGLDLLAVGMDDLSDVASMRGIAASRTLFQGAGIINDVPVVECRDDVVNEPLAETERGILLF